MTTTTDFLAERRTGIGGSDIAAICGRSKWKTPLDVWREKVLEGTPIEESEPMKWGTLLEPAIRREAGKRLHKKVRGPMFVRDGIHLGHLDGLVGDDVLEVKTARSDDDWGEEGTDEIPDAYLAQVQWYLGLTKRPMAHVAVLFGGSDFRLYHVAPAPQVIAALQFAADNFWQTNVLTKTPPEPSSLADAKKLWHRAVEGKSLPITAAALEAMEKLEAMKERAKGLQQDIDTQQMILRCQIGEAEALIDSEGNPLVTLKNQTVSEYLVPAREQRVLRLTKHWTKRNNK